MPTKTYFGNFRKVIETELLKARFDIYVAVAWFTDKLLFDTICSKAKEGVNTKIILIKDKTNSDARFDHRDIEKFGGTFYYRDHHHKFCVIDRKILINGSSNWTYKAFKGHVEENISVIDEEKEAMKFANIFQKLIAKQVEVQDYDFTDDYKLKFVASFQRLIDLCKDDGYILHFPKGVGIETLWEKQPHTFAFFKENDPNQKIFIIISPELREVLDDVRNKLLYLPVFGIVDRWGNPFNNSFVLGLESNSEQRFDPLSTL